MKISYLKDIRKKQWIHVQEQRLWWIVTKAFAEVEDPHRDIWAKRLWRNFCERLEPITKCEWIIFLAELNDEQAWGRYTMKKARCYCCLIRDTAYSFCLRNGLVEEKARQIPWHENYLPRGSAPDAEDITYM